MMKSNKTIASSGKYELEESDGDDYETTFASSEDEEETERELVEPTFGELHKARADGSHYVYRKQNQELKFGRANKNRLMEVSTKKPVSRFREAVEAPKKVIRDPRFKSECGNLDVYEYFKFQMMKSSKAIASSSKSQLEETDGDDYEATYASFEDEEEIEHELAAEPTFGELHQARADGSLRVYRRQHQGQKFRRANKNRPMELSAKMPVSRFRVVVQAPKKEVRDPRFDPRCGKVDVDGFRKRYNFLFEDYLPAEKEELKKQLKKTNDAKVVEELKNRISWIEKLSKFGTKKSSDAAILSEHKKKEREAAKHGKRPFYLKKSEIRKRGLVEQYNKLKASGKLESFIEKKRRKNASKDRKYMPYRRPNANANAEQ